MHAPRAYATSWHYSPNGDLRVVGTRALRLPSSFMRVELSIWPIDRLAGGVSCLQVRPQTSILFLVSCTVSRKIFGNGGSTTHAR